MGANVSGVQVLQLQYKDEQDNVQYLTFGQDGEVSSAPNPPGTTTYEEVPGNEDTINTALMVSIILLSLGLIVTLGTLLRKKTENNDRWYPGVLVTYLLLVSVTFGSCASSFTKTTSKATPNNISSTYVIPTPTPTPMPTVVPPMVP